MWRAVRRLGGGLLAAVAAIGIVFVVGMRTKSPLVLNAVRRTGRATKRFVLPSAGTPGGIASVIRHDGRVSGRPYETPVNAVPTDEGFVIALPYGRNTDWLKNVLAKGSATIVHEGATHRLDRPEIVGTPVVAALFPSKDQQMHRRFRVDECLLLRRVDVGDAADRIADPT